MTDDVQFLPVTEENKAQALALAIAPAQHGSVESVAECLAEAAQLSLWRPVIIVLDRQAVGFAMYGLWKEEGESGRVWLDRFFIDARFQGKGCARTVLPALLRDIRARYGCDTVFLSVYETNALARRLYETLGFSYNGERDINGELVMVQTAQAAQVAPQPVRGRFAPSPSGRMHLGNVFTALLAWLSVRSRGGTLLLRVEDLDVSRCKPEYAKQLLDDLDWLGLTWDAGGLVPGYVQREESEYYAQCLRQVEARAQVYPCFCTRASLHAASAPHSADGTPVYSGACRSLTPAQRTALAETHAPALRLAVPQETISFWDGVYGMQTEDLSTACGDFLLRRSDGVFAYQLAAVADDARMGVTEVVRGRDLLSSTARQLYLYRLLDAPPPQFYHVPLLCAPDGRRLSKRERDLDMGALRARCTPREVIGTLAALAGIVPAGTQAMPEEIIAQFHWDKIARTDLRVDADLL